jgi:hypothetical protein
MAYTKLVPAEKERKRLIYQCLQRGDARGELPCCAMEQNWMPFWQTASCTVEKVFLAWTRVALM